MKTRKALGRDPVCGMKVDPQQAAASQEHLGRIFYFCSPECAQEFEKNPYRYMQTEPAQHTGHSGCC